MREAGVDTSAVKTHVFEAFSLAFSFSLAIAMLTSLIIAGVIAWYFARRVSGPIERMALVAETLSTDGGHAIENLETTSPEMERLASALSNISHQLSKSQDDQRRMLRDLAHELRTPISTIRALIDGIEDGIVQGDAHSWNTIRDQLERLNRLSHDVRDVSQPHDSFLNNQEVSIFPPNIAHSAISAWQAQFEKKGVSLSLHYDNPIPEIIVDPIRIGQVLSNLLENALRHTPAAGTARLIIESVHGGVSFEVRDSGEGITTSQMPHIFDRLYRGDMARTAGDSGSGLGLSIARNIAESHHGTLTAMSEGLGKGSSFVLTIPVLVQRV
jgi:signal transduction histidine kinase